MNGVELIAAERRRQISEKGYSPNHDQEHKDLELARAAIGYLAAGYSDLCSNDVDRIWPKGWEFKDCDDDPVEYLVKAGALIAAEIDRINKTQPRHY